MLAHYTVCDDVLWTASAVCCTKPQYDTWFPVPSKCIKTAMCLYWLAWCNCLCYALLVGSKASFKLYESQQQKWNHIHLFLSIPFVIHSFHHHHMHSYTIHSTVSVLSLHSSVFVWLLCVLCVVVVFFFPSKFYLFLLCSCSDRMVCRFESTLLKHLRSELLSLLSVDPHSTSLTNHLVVVVFFISFLLWHFTYIHFFLKISMHFL